MTRNADRNNVKPMVGGVAPMVIVFCLLATNNTMPSCYFRQHTFNNGVHNGVLGVALIRVVNAVSFLAGDNLFWVIFLMPFAYSAALIYVLAAPLALILCHARFAPGSVTVTIPLVRLELRHGLFDTAFSANLSSHSHSNNNARHAAHVKLPRPHIRRDGRSYQYSTRACGLGNQKYITEGAI